LNQVEPKERAEKRRKEVNSLAAIILWAVMLVHFLLTMNCSGWSEANMAVQSCHIDFPIARNLSNLHYELILFSAFTMFFPLVAYYFVLRWLTRKFATYFLMPGNK
jgi:hypothetical protein